MILARSVVALSNDTAFLIFGPMFFKPKFILYSLDLTGATPINTLQASVVGAGGTVDRAVLDAGDQLLGGSGGILRIVVGIGVGTAEFAVVPVVTHVPIDGRDALNKYIAVGLTELNSQTIDGWIGIG